MAKRKPVKKDTDGPTLGQFFGDIVSVKFTFASKLCRLAQAEWPDDGFDMFDKHLSLRNLVQCGTAGFAPGVPVYRVAKPDAKAILT